MRLTKEEFIKYVNTIDESMQYFDEFEKVLGGNIFEGPLYEPINTLISLLEDLCEFKEENIHYGNDLIYFMYELDFGRRYTNGCIVDKNKNPIDISTAEKLYDYIVANQNE